MFNHIMDNITALTGTITNIHVEEIRLNESFLDLASRFVQMTGTVVLMSGGDLDSARHHILAVKPWLCFSGHGKNLNLVVDQHVFQVTADPFDILKVLLKTDGRLPYRESKGASFPVQSGLFGYLSYDLKDHLEQLPRTSMDDLGLPQICLYAPAVIVTHDKKTEKTHVIIPERGPSGNTQLKSNRTFFRSHISGPAPETSAFYGNADGFLSDFDPDHYRETIQTIREYIASGHVYQVNMSQRFKTGFKGDPFALFRTLFQKNPAPFFAFINAGDHQIISTSPERFIQRIHDRVETRPIKGTRPRGKDPLSDQQFRSSLMESEKDDAELSMIVDLLRNDLGKVCAAGTVRIKSHKRLETYQNVHHLVSIVDGKLLNGNDSVDFIKAVFPGGSITGCPKIRSMEIIDELEPVRRHVYTGAIGYISFHDTLDLSIAIRTATLFNHHLYFSAGGGIVYDSIPQDEYEETLHKGRTLMEVFKDAAFKPVEEPFVWMNGRIVALSDAVIPVNDLGLQYGFGLFETIRVEAGKPCHLKEHIARFNHAWEGLFQQDPLDLTWDVIIRDLITRNQLNQTISSAKIMATKGNRKAPPHDPTVIVTCRPYIHRLAEKKASGLSLRTYPYPRETPLADYKTLNYLFYYMAGQWANANGGDEALIQNPDRSLSETNTGNLLLIREKTVIRPWSHHVLPGIMENVVCRSLKEWGYEIKRKQVFSRDLFQQNLVVVTNSLMGAVPVLDLDGQPLPGPKPFWKKINHVVLGESS